MDFFMDPNDLPDHVKQELDRRAMRVDIIKHDIERLLDELSKDHLVTLRYILHNAGGNEAYAAYLTGTIGGTLKYKYGVCGCGEDHDKDLLDPTGKASVGSSTSTPDTVQAAVTDASLDAARYEVEFASDDRTHDGPVDCIGICAEGDGPARGKWVSLADRMLREPGVKGCESCQHKQKWG